MPVVASRQRRKVGGHSLVAVAHSLLVAIYHMRKDGSMHHDLGADYFEERDRDHLVRRAVSQLQHFGHRVSLEEIA